MLATVQFSVQGELARRPRGGPFPEAVIVVSVGALSEFGAAVAAQRGALRYAMRRIALLLAFLLCGTPLIPLTAQSPTRIIAIGDIHGSIDGFTAILRKTGLIDDRQKWTGGRTQLLQTGDYTDRGE